MITLILTLYIYASPAVIAPQDHEIYYSECEVVIGQKQCEEGGASIEKAVYTFTVARGISRDPYDPTTEFV